MKTKAELKEEMLKDFARNLRKELGNMPFNSKRATVDVLGMSYEDIDDTAMERYVIAKVRIFRDKKFIITDIRFQMFGIEYDNGGRDSYPMIPDFKISAYELSEACKDSIGTSRSGSVGGIFDTYSKY